MIIYKLIALFSLLPFSFLEAYSISEVILVLACLGGVSGLFVRVFAADLNEGPLDEFSTEKLIGDGESDRSSLKIYTDEKNNQKSRVNRAYLLDNAIKTLKETKIDTDRIIQYFLLVAFLVYDLLLDAYALIFNRSKNREESLVKIQKANELKKIISSISDDELKNIVDEIEITEGSNRNLLFELIKSNPNACEKLEIAKRKSDLMSMRNQDLRSMLSGVEKVYKLNKSQLVEKIISIESKN